MKWFLTLILLSTFTWTIQGQQIKLPLVIKGKPGEFIRVPAVTDGVNVGWYSVTPGLNIFPVDLLKDSKTAVVTAIAPGKYKLIAYTALNNNVTVPPAECIVEIGDGLPIPPDPVNPPDPKPQTEEVKLLKTAWEKDGKSKNELINVMECLKDGVSCLNQENIVSFGGFVGCLKESFNTKFKLDQAINLRKEMSLQFFKGMPTDLTLYLDDSLKTRVRERMDTIVERLNQVKDQ
jgi:hypothetical protein